MSLVLSLQFPWGRYHATPWGRHANEGAVEWPPSPWRLVRALVAVWQERVPDLPAEEVRDALDLLCGTPTYVLPPSRAAHTRHYLPDSNDRRREGKHSTDLALDGFVSVGPRGTAYLKWDADPTPIQRATLATLLDRLPYLGRSESVVLAGIAEPSPEEDAAGERWTPVVAGGDLAVEPLRLLVPDRPLDLAAVIVRTGRLHKDRRLQPPGTSWAVYTRDSRDAPSSRPVAPAASTRSRPTVLEFAVSGTRLPQLTHAVPLATLIRKAAIRSHGDPSRTLSGHDERGNMLEDGHAHAHYLSLGNDRGLVDRIVVWAPRGLSDLEVAALAGLAGSRAVPDHLRRALGQTLRLGLQYLGGLGGADSRLYGSARRWRTLTPFTPTRYHKRRDGDVAAWIGAQVRRELANRGLPSSEDAVEVVLRDDRWQDHRRQRDGRIGGPPARHLDLDFAETLQGPLTLGRLSHFGLGLFVPVAE